MNIQQLRSETPGCAGRVHLNNAGAALMPASVIRAIQEHITLESLIGGYEAAADRAEAIHAAYGSVAELLGAHSRNVAFTENATASYQQALSSVPFERGDLILTTCNDYASNQIQFLSMQKRLGLQVMRAPDKPEGGVDVSAMKELIRRHRPRLVCVTHVPTSSGLVQDVRSVGAACREEDVLYLVDACQSAGQMPLDVQEMGCDFLSATARKFLRGPRGAGFLFVSDRVLDQGLEPMFIDMRGADWIGDDQYRPAGGARRFENWEFAWGLVLATGEAARYAMSIGMDGIWERVKSLGERLRESLRALEHVRVLDRGTELCGIVTVWIDGWNPADVVTELRRQGINTSSQNRESAVIHYDQCGVSGALRLSPHYYNTEAEIDQVVDALRALAPVKTTASSQTRS